jgi:hypothetical protein
MAIMDEYNTVYLFFQWLRIQSTKGESLYKDITFSSFSNYQAVTSNAHRGNRDDLLAGWYASNYFGNSSGEYGYKNEVGIRDVGGKFPLAAAASSINLYPGEGVLSRAKAYNVPGPTAPIRYKGLNASSVFDSGPIADGALLTYNADTDIAGSARSGNTAPVVANISMNVVSTGTEIEYGKYDYPLRIGMNDVLKRNGIEIDFSAMNLKSKVEVESE